jgi:membrane protease subunit HflK
MNTKIRTSLIAISITLGLTLLKFLFYFLSGSIAVLSEAWHSFSDITTSVLVLFALWRSACLARRPPQPDAEGGRVDGTARPLGFRRFMGRLFGEQIESTSSLLIGVFLTFISVSLILNAWSTKIVLIQRPLLTGILFLILSAGSYFLFRFLSDVGRAENSAALISDGLHSKGDMACSSLAGLSLILYHFGINIDRWVSLAIALLILSFGVEILFNVFAHLYGKRRDFRMRYRFLEILGIGFEKETYLRLFRWIDRKYSVDILRSTLVRYARLSLRYSGYALAGAALLALLYDMRFQLEMDEQAVVERFGKPRTTEPLGPGLHFKLPRPIDRVRVVQTGRIQELFLGNVSQEEERPLIWGNEHGEEVHFLSGDNNFLNPYITLHYRIRNLYAYFYNIENPTVLMENISYKILQDLFTAKPFYDIAITYRREMESAVATALQQRLDALDTGIEVVAVNVKDIHPPVMISDSFENVIASYQKKEETINLALEYRNAEIPASRGKAYTNVSDARAYVQEEVLKSQAAVAGFRAKWSAYRSHKPVIRQVLYFTSIVTALGEREKILVDPRTGELDLYLTSGAAVPLPGPGGTEE